MTTVCVLIKTTHPSYDLTKIWFEDISVYNSYPLAIKMLHKKQDEEIERVKEVKRIGSIPYMERPREEKIFESQNSGYKVSYKLLEKTLIES
jgi:hypothetical protein